MRQQLFAGLLLAVSALLLLSLVLPGLSLAQGEVWRGIPVAPESRCSPYDRDDYPYSQSVELQIIAREGGQICSPYTNECFESRFDTDIEHIIAVSEAHDSGLCAASAATRAQFASDLRNLTLASPALNRTQKRAKDAAEWLPAQNRCWFARQIVTVRRAYSLTIDRQEADALDRVIAGCSPLNLASIAWQEIYPSIQEIYASVQVFSAISERAPVCADAADAQPTPTPDPQFSCNCGKGCSEMASCEEALFQLNQCNCTRRDTDNDGVPCESICPGG